MTQASRSPIQPDPEKFDAVRNVAARKRGLEQPYITGGEDPELGETLGRERPYLQILIGMVILIVAIGFVLGFAGALLNAPPA